MERRLKQGENDDDHGRSIQDATDLAIHGFHGLNDSVRHGGVADHVTVREVHDDQRMPSLTHRTNDRISDGRGTHLRHQVIGRDLG